MYYAKWCKEIEMKKNLKEINIGQENKKGGIPIINDGKKAYIPNREAHTLVIGSIGSGKTQTTILPLIKTALLANESVVINDVKGELYQKLAYNFQEKGYDIIVLDLDNPNQGNSWNPLTLPYELYRKGEKDKATKLIEDLGYYLLSDIKNTNSDLFWTNSATDYFTGLTLYLFENASLDELNLNSIYTLANELDDPKKASNFLKNLDKTSTIYYNVLGTLSSPPETKGGIIATFNQKLKKYISLEDLSKMLSQTDFDIKEISNKKTAIFIISGLSTQSSYLIPLFVNQLINETNEFGTHTKTLNMILDEFDTMLPINNFTSLINYSRSINIRFTVVIKSYIDLKNIYGKEQTEIIKSCFPIIIYLLSNDIYTLEEISKMCGNKEQNKQIVPLITIEELKVMPQFAAIVLIPRIMPFKTKLLPDYKINWNLKEEDSKIPTRKSKKIEIYKSNL